METAVGDCNNLVGIEFFLTRSATRTSNGNFVPLLFNFARSLYWYGFGPAFNETRMKLISTASACSEIKIQSHLRIYSEFTSTQIKILRDVDNSMEDAAKSFNNGSTSATR